MGEEEKVVVVVEEEREVGERKRVRGRQEKREGGKEVGEKEEGKDGERGGRISAYDITLSTYQLHY